MIGTHGLGHARLATESSVLPNASHPFWARPFSDVAIVHNGQITNYWKMRRRLEQRDYKFTTDNDSELIAVWVSDQIKAGLTMDAALRKSITSIDGVFTYMIARPDGIGFAKDRFAMKPLVVIPYLAEPSFPPGLYWPGPGATVLRSILPILGPVPSTKAGDLFLVFSGEGEYCPGPGSATFGLAATLRPKLNLEPSTALFFDS